MDTADLEEIFQHKVLGMLLRKAKIKKAMARLILSRRHSGFNVHCGPRIQPGDERPGYSILELRKKIADRRLDASRFITLDIGEILPLVP